MRLTTPYLRYLTAIILVMATTSDFVADALYQASFVGFDGPLAWYSSYTFGLNKIVFALALAAILIVDFKLVLAKPWNRIVRVVCICCGILSSVGFLYLIREHIFFQQSGQMSWPFLRSLLSLYLFQLVFILVSIIVFRKTEPIGPMTSKSAVQNNA